MPPKLRDIAEACDVDVSTVSRALRGDKRIGTGTVERIRAAAERIGYLANPSARALAGAKTYVVWLILSHMGNVLEQEIAEAASRYLESKGYDLAVVLCHSNPDRYSYLLRRLRSNPVDGALVVPPFSSEKTSCGDVAQMGESEGFPLVFIDRYPEHTRHPVVTTCNRKAAGDLAEALVREGAEQVVVLDNPKANAVQKERCLGYCEKAEELGVSCVLENESPLLEGPRSIALVGSSANPVEKWMKNRKEPQEAAILAGVFDAWVGDRSGYDCIYVCRQDFKTMAERAVDALLAQLHGDPAAESRVEVGVKSCVKLT